MKYILKHKEYGTYYCFDKKDKYVRYSVECKNAYVFKTAKSAGRIRNKFKHPDRWEIVEVMK